MFHVRKPGPSLLDHALTAIAFSLMLAGWCVTYVTICPADPVTHRTHVAEVLR